MTKSRAPMKFISFEDTTGIYETIFFPDTYRRFSGVLGQDRPYIIKGKVEEDFGTISLIVSWIGILKNSAPSSTNASSFHNERHETECVG